MIGYPRLVRLNPNIPWKTRGNGALSFHLAQGKGKPQCIGSYKGTSIQSYSRLNTEIPVDHYSQILDTIQNIISRHAQLKNTKTNPGVVILPSQPKRSWYIQAVTSIVSLLDIQKYLTENSAVYKGYKTKRGLIGATAASAWATQDDATYELISYRQRSRWGTTREVDDESVKELDLCYLDTVSYTHLRAHET